MDILKVKDLVFEILTNDPLTRDNDNLLICEVWKRQVDNLNFMNFVKFENLFTQNKLHAPESITRCRRKHQEQNPHLRGQEYYKRHEQQEEVKNQLKAF